jgi:hypothetical protein
VGANMKKLKGKVFNAALNDESEKEEEKEDS